MWVSPDFSLCLKNVKKFELKFSLASARKYRREIFKVDYFFLLFQLWGWFRDFRRWTNSAIQGNLKQKVTFSFWFSFRWTSINCCSTDSFVLEVHLAKLFQGEDFFEYWFILSGKLNQSLLPQVLACFLKINGFANATKRFPIRFSSLKFIIFSHGWHVLRSFKF